jgi:HNH endonuclease
VTQRTQEELLYELAREGPVEISETVVSLPNDGSVNCALHRYHSPEVTSFDRHHVWPKGDGGPDEESNLAVVCPTGHRNVHILLMLMHRIGPENVERTSWGEATWEMALAGFEQGKAQA